MGLDLVIVFIYFAIVFIVALSGKQGKDVSTEEYFLSSRNLKWYSIAISSIATNIQGLHLLGMMGSAYAFGLAQAQFEINAIQGMFMAAFIFIPMYLKDRVITVTQFIKSKLGNHVGLAYTSFNLLLFATLGIGGALFWAAFAADLVFEEYMALIHPDRFTRTCIVAAGLGVFSAIYTFLGGLRAVVRTDIIQFTILTIGGFSLFFVALYHLGGWSELYNVVGKEGNELMHLHLPADHEKLPWTVVFGLFFLNINYWCANQSVIQRSLAARSLKDAQMGMMVGGVLKYFMAAMLIIPGIALAGILADTPLADPDAAFPTLVKDFLPMGVRGLILCTVFASLMSTVDSLFNSMATLWSIDIYKEYINPKAEDRQVVQAGRYTIIVTLFTGVFVSFLLLYAKLSETEFAFTHTLNELRYYVNTAIVVVICMAAFVLAPKHRFALVAMLITPLIFQFYKVVLPDTSYIMRAFYTIVTGLLPMLIVGGMKPAKDYLVFADNQVRNFGIGLLISLVLCHWIFS